MKINEETVIEFIKRNFTEDPLSSDGYSKFKNLVSDGKDIAAAEEYCKVTGSNIDEAHLAVSVATSHK